MAPAVSETPPAPTRAAQATARRLRASSLANVSRMGDCAPAVMQTLLDAFGMDAPWLVKVTAGVPGGIGNTGGECMIQDAKRAAS